MTALTSRGRFEGVNKIIRFNTRFYIASILGVASAVLVLTLLRLPLWLEELAVAVTGLMLFWTLSSLLVSWYVYDYAEVRGGSGCEPVCGTCRQNG